MASDRITVLLQDILAWMDGHDDVLPKLVRAPTPSQKEEASLRKRYQNYLERNDALTAEQRKMQQEIDRRKTDQVDIDNIERIEKWSAQRGSRLPVHSKDDVEQNTLAQRLRRLQAKDKKSPMLQKRLVELSSTVLDTPTKKKARGAVYKLRKQKVAELVENVVKEYDEWCKFHNPLLTQDERKDRFDRGEPVLQRANPYPGLANLGGTCYANAVCQALFHCDAARNWLRTCIEAASVADESPREFVQALQNLAEALIDGVSTGQADQRCHFDIWSPHALIDKLVQHSCLARQRPDALRIGQQHDAREALEEILTCTRMGEELCSTGCQQFQRPDIVPLDAFAKDGWWYKDYMSDQQIIDMRSLLSDGFAYVSEKFHMAPRLLIVMVPPFAHDESDTTFCLNSQYVHSDWGDCTLDLEERCADHCVDRDKAKYRLAAYVAYQADEDVTPSWAFSSGHFVAYFREEGRWYEADDSTVAETGVNGSPPSAFPYICILERLDLQPAMPWPPMHTASDDEDEDATRTSQGHSAAASASAQGNKQALMLTPRAKRNRKEREHSADSPRPEQSAPTPKRRRLVGKQGPSQVWQVWRNDWLPKRMNLWHGAHGCAQDERNRAGRKQDRAGRKQDRAGRKQQRDQAGRKQVGRKQERDQAGRKQVGRKQERDQAGRKQVGRKQDRSERQQEDLRRMRSRPLASDNLDGTRQDMQANLHNPVLDSVHEIKKRSLACDQRSLYGDVFLLLHLLDPWVKVEDAIREFEDFYLYAGFDCTRKWANFLGDASRKKQMSVRLQEALAIMDEEIEACRKKVMSKQWNLVDVVIALEGLLLGENCGAPYSLAEHMSSHCGTDCPAGGTQDMNPVMVYLKTGTSV